MFWHGQKKKKKDNRGQHMKTNDLKKFTGIFITMHEIFGKGREPSEILITTYFEALKEFSIEEISKAVSAVIRKYKYDCLPKPAEIINQITGNPDDRALLAWGKFLKALQRYGHYHSVRFDDPVIHSVVQAMGGWIKIADWQDKELQWNQKRFVEFYNSYRNKHEHPEYLGGLRESENGQADVVFIGDKGAKVLEMPKRKDREIFKSINEREMP
jgi:uncharacterized protein DUF6475